MEEEDTFKTVNSKESLKKWLIQGDNGTVMATWKPSVVSSAKEVKRQEIEKDTEMKEAGKATEGLVESKHFVKGLSEKEVEDMVKEIGLEEEKIEDKDKDMKQEEEEGRSDLFNAPQDWRNALRLIKSILKNNEVVEECRALLNKKKWSKPAKDANLAKRLILAAGDIIEERYWKGGDLEGKDGWKAVTEILLEAGDLERVKEASKAERI